MISRESFSLRDYKCGEVFVTSYADNWTFLCSYCQKATNDIGVFICHIRLDHLSGLNNFQQPENIQTTDTSESRNMPTIQTVSSFTKEDEYTERNLIKEESLSQCVDITEKFHSQNSQIVDIASSSDSNQTENVFSETCISPDYPPVNIKEEIFTNAQQDKKEIIKNVQLIYTENDKSASNLNKANKAIVIDDDNVNDPDTCSICSANNESELTKESITDFNIIDDNRYTGNKRRKKEKQYEQHICKLCNMNFKYKLELEHHLKVIHNLKLSKMPLKCKKCKKNFRSVAGLKNHLKAHDEKFQTQCPICQATHNQNYFIAHVLTHESDTCFPCQVCGKIFINNEERMKHWKTHINEMPFECDFCYRRFRKQQYLTHHLKSHYQYQCQFCPTQFNAVEPQKPPYICTTCESLPALNQKLLKNKNSFVFNRISKAKVKACKPLQPEEWKK